jgi:hypothetical protein
MPLYRYEEIHKDKVKPEIQAHYADTIAEIRALGFNEEFYVSEWERGRRSDPFEKGSLWREQAYSRRFSYTPILIHQHDYAYATIVGEWVTFATIFNNESVAQTTSVASVGPIRSNPEEMYFLHVCQSKMAADIWELHQRCVKNTGRSVLPLLSLKEALRLQCRINEIQDGDIPLSWYEDEGAKKKGK